MAFETDGKVHGTIDATTSYETKDTDETTYSESTENNSPGVGTNPGDSSDEVEPRKLMRDPSINDIRWLYRTSWAQTLVDKPIDDAFKNGYELVHEEERDFRDILDKHDWEQHYKTVRKKARRDGFALNFLILNDDAEGPWEDPMSDNVSVSGIHKIETLTLDDLARYKSSRGVVRAGDRLDPLTERLDYDQYEIRPTGIVVDIDPSSDTYKEPLGYLVGPDNWPSNHDDVKFIHRNRVRHYTENPEVDSDLEQNTYGTYEGDSVLVSSYHILKGIKKGNWSLMQTIFRYAAKLYHVELPEDADEDDWENANDQLQNLNAKGEIITPHGYEMEDFQTDGQLEPREYFDVLFEQACASNEMTKSVLFGTQTGTVSGSETDIKNYFNKVERMRQREIVDHIRGFVSDYVKLTDSRADSTYEANFEVDWGPLFKMTELDQAETLSRKMQTLSAAINNFVMTPAEARRILDEEWGEFDPDETDLSAAEREFIEAIMVAQQGSEKSLTNRNEQEGIQGSTQQQNGGGRQQGETSDPSNPTSDASPVADPSDPDQWGDATSTLLDHATLSLDALTQGEFVDTPEGRGLIFEVKDGKLVFQGEEFDPEGEIAVVALESGGSAVYDGESVLATTGQSVELDLPEGWDKGSLLDWWASVGADFSDAADQLKKKRNISTEQAEQIAASYKDMALGTEDWRGEGADAY